MPPVGAFWPSRGSEGGSQPSPGEPDPAGDRDIRELHLAWPVTPTSTTGGLFQRPGPFPAPPPASTDIQQRIRHTMRQIRLLICRGITDGRLRLRASDRIAAYPSHPPHRPGG